MKIISRIREIRIERRGQGYSYKKLQLIASRNGKVMLRVLRVNGRDHSKDKLLSSVSLPVTRLKNEMEFIHRWSLLQKDKI